MSLSRYSELALVTTLVAVVLTAGVAGAVSVTEESVPEEAEVGEEVTVTVELEDLYENGDDDYDLMGLTELRDATWTVEEYDDLGFIQESTYQGEEFVHEGVDSSRDPAPQRIVVEVTGTVPPVEEYTYDSRESFEVLHLGQTWGSEGQEIDKWTAHHYTTADGDAAGSREARTAIEDARAAIDDADDGTDVSEAESLYDDAVAFYEDGAFDDAVAAADDAVAALESDDESTAENDTSDGEDAGDSESETDDATAESDSQSDEDEAGADESDDSDDGSGILTLFLYLLGFVALVAVIGGVLYFRQQQQSPNRDPLG